MLDTLEHLQKIDFPPIRRKQLEVLQVNLGYKCNQQCLHCHVNAGPNRIEMMSKEVIEEIKKFVLNNQIKALDLTGGAPELHPGFKEFVSWARKNEVKVIDRCNLTILFEQGQEGLAQFLADKGIEVVASMPCYLKENVDNQRGKGTFDKSIKALKLLNSLGFGKIDSDLTLNLVYNPQGASLPPPQERLESDYKKYMWDNYQIEFNQLLALANLPIARFGSSLLSNGQFSSYMQLLQGSYRVENLKHVMCRSLVSIDWQGRAYDCDFNQMLKIGIKDTKNQPVTIMSLNVNKNLNLNIEVAGHCYGCVSGQGSGCSGAFSE